MKEQEFRKMVREEIQHILFEESPFEENKENLISQIYQWIIRGDMDKAMKAMQNDPELLKLAKNVDDLKAELLKRMAGDDVFMSLLANSVRRLKAKKGIE